MFSLQYENIQLLPLLPYQMEFAAIAHSRLQALGAEAIAIDLPEAYEDAFLAASMRLPDISLIKKAEGTYFLVEPCDARFEALRYSLEAQTKRYCIAKSDKLSLLSHYPDAYAVYRIGLEKYYKGVSKEKELDEESKYQARRLKDLSLRHESVLYLGQIDRLPQILHALKSQSFDKTCQVDRKLALLCTPSEKSYREILLTGAYFLNAYELARKEGQLPLDRQKLIFSLFDEAKGRYCKNTNNDFPHYQSKNLAKFSRNLALRKGLLLADLHLQITAARACVDHNYAYELWELATHYPFYKNIDQLTTVDISPKELWGDSKNIRFELKSKSKKSFFKRLEKSKEIPQKAQDSFFFSICSHPPEDLIIENFAEFLQKKSQQVLMEENARTIPFSSSLEEGIDCKESIRHWHEKKLYVKKQGKAQGACGSVVVIFDEDENDKYPWKTTWQGEHNQESDMAFYASPAGEKLVGPGISKSKYGGFLMSYPPRRLYDVWSDPDYSHLRSKAEVLLLAGIDYATKPLIAYVAAKAPRSLFKSIAKRYGRKIVFIPIGSLSRVLLSKIRSFHVLDSQKRRSIADDYIY